MKKYNLSDLARRERQIMDIVFKLGKASAGDIRKALPDALSDSGVRTILRVLLKKGYLRHKEKGLKYYYYPAINREKAETTTLNNLKKTLFDNSAERLMSALIKSNDVSADELDKLAKMIDNARKEGK